MVKLFFDLQRRMMLFDLTSFHHLQNFGQCATGCFCSFLLNSLGTMNLEVEFHDALVWCIIKVSAYLIQTPKAQIIIKQTEIDASVI